MSKRIKRVQAVCLMLAVLALSHGCRTPDETADLVIVNGRIWTGSTAQPWAQGMAVSGERLLAVGSTEKVTSLRGPSTQVLDLGGRLVVPGFNDAHTHFLALDRAVLDEAHNLGDLQRRLLDFATRHPDHAWVVGRGWVYTMFPQRTPHRRYLDDVIPDRPVLIRDRDGHAALVNSKALELAGITRQTPDPADGIVVRGADGLATGLLKESAVGLVSRNIPPASDGELYQTLRRRLDEAASYGITSVQNASSIRLEVWRRVFDEGGLKVRVYASLPFEKEVSQETLARYRQLKEEFSGPWIRFGAVKGMVDGTVDSKTAALFEPYVGGGNAEPRWSQDELNDAVGLHDREGFQILLHAIGDRAVNMALNAFEHAAATNGTAGRRHRVEHIEVPALADLPRFRQLGVIASTQAIFADPDEATLGNYAVLLGPERSGRSNAFRLFDDAGAVQAFGSDWPVFPMDPLQGIRAAVLRETAGGTPEGGWYPENRIPVDAALRHYTRDSAYASLEENLKGTLEPGKFADFAVLSHNIVESTPDKIRDTHVVLTVAGGRVTFSSGVVGHGNGPWRE